MLYGPPNYTVDAGKWTFTEKNTKVQVPCDFREYLSDQSRNPGPRLPNGGSFEVVLPNGTTRELRLDPGKKVQKDSVQLAERFFVDPTGPPLPPGMIAMAESLSISSP